MSDTNPAAPVTALVTLALVPEGSPSGVWGHALPDYENIFPPLHEHLTGGTRVGHGRRQDCLILAFQNFFRGWFHWFRRAGAGWMGSLNHVRLFRAAHMWNSFPVPPLPTAYPLTTLILNFNSLRIHVVRKQPTNQLAGGGRLNKTNFALWKGAVETMWSEGSWIVFP